MKASFAQRIAAMNAMHRLPAHDRPSLPEPKTRALLEERGVSRAA
jgi:hypothetical protein